MAPSLNISRGPLLICDATVYTVYLLYRLIDWLMSCQIFDGELPRSPSLGVYCGHDTPSDVVQSTGSVMAVHFRSDSGLIGRGFRATYTSNEPAGLSLAYLRWR